MKALPDDFEVRVEHLQQHVQCLRQTVSSCVAYSGLQPAPPMIAGLVDRVYQEARELVPDEHYFDDLHAAGMDHPVARSLLETSTVLSIVSTALESLSPGQQFGFNR